MNGGTTLALTDRSNRRYHAVSLRYCCIVLLYLLVPYTLREKRRDPLFLRLRLLVTSLPWQTAQFPPPADVAQSGCIPLTRLPAPSFVHSTYSFGSMKIKKHE
ncbi:hypothetical protein IAQ61_011186, partial [Plenodomus lingam]|uniref:Predicted protein n=1 Tax=Leptosphaeria maculans (strain JN3 / isolate v23.1.3 / race Av1-4-5-6-7-8) TaxID=985895 RepID=E5A9B1_LEPMJ